MLTTNTMRYGTDDFAFDHSGTIKPNAPWDFANVTSVDGFTITGSQPTGTGRRAVFIVNGTHYKLTIANGVGTLSAVADGDVETILADGNTMAELATVTSIPEFVDEQVYPVFALYADGDVEAANFPTLSVDVIYTANGDQYVKTDYSQEIELASSDVTIVSTNVVSEVTEGNSVEVTASLYKNGGWGEYTALSDIIGETATKIKFKAVYTVETIGVGTATLTSVRVGFRNNNAKTSSPNSVIITNTRNLGMAARYIRTSLVHDKLKDSEIKASVAFRDGTQKKTLVPLGTATGSLQTFNLPDADVVPSSISVKVGNNPLYSYDYNLAVGTITLTGEAGQVVYVSYEYGAGTEEWNEMLAVGTQVYETDKTKYNSSFSYALPDNAVGKEIAAVKYEMNQLPGTATQNLGTATGAQQKFLLTHDVKEDTLSIPGAEFYVQDNVVTLVAPAGTNLVATYDYNGVPAVAYNYVVAWND